MAAVGPLPDARLTELAADPEWSPLPELATYAALFNCASETFGDPALREAMTALIADQVLPALGSPGHQEALRVVGGGGEGPAPPGWAASTTPRPCC